MSTRNSSRFTPIIIAISVVAGSIFVCCGFSSVFVSELRSRGNGGEPPY